MHKKSYESIREKYRPRQTRVLFIGESRPANGTFFYCGDSTLARYTCEAFEVVYGSFPDISSFLAGFQALGCFLVDLCPEPVNHLSRKQRRQKHKAGEGALAVMLSALKPLALVVVMKGIACSVNQAARIADAGITLRYDLPFPAQHHQKEYVFGLSTIISGLKREGVLENTRQPGVRAEGGRSERGKCLDSVLISGKPISEPQQKIKSVYCPGWGVGNLKHNHWIIIFKDGSVIYTTEPVTVKYRVKEKCDE